MVNSVVLVDDNKTTNFIHTKFIKESGRVKEVHTFSLGEMALKYLENTDNFPELIFIDINMPTMDAWEFLRGYKEITRSNDAKIFLLSTSISPQEEAKMKEFSEVEKLIFKPLTVEVFNRIVDEHFVK